MPFFPIPWYLIIALIIIVIITTSLGSIAGFSGSVFIVPIFSLILISYNVPFITIVGCSASGCFFNGLLSSILNTRRKEIDWVIAIIFEAPTMIGVFIGAFLTTRLNNQVITTFFASFVVVLAIIFFIQTLKTDDFPPINKKKKQKSKSKKTPDTITKLESENNGLKEEVQQKKRKKTFLRRIAEFGPQWKIDRESYSYTINLVMLVISAFFIGFLAGMVGCGGGWVKAPILVTGFGVPSLIATSTSMLMTTITLLISGIIHIALGHFVLWLWLIIAIGSIFGSIIGTSLKKRFTSRVLRIIMIISLISIAILLLTQTWINPL